MRGFQAGQTVLVTGASSGIGAATAKRFAAEGGRVIACGRRLAPLEALVQEMGAGAIAVELDVRDANSVAQAFEGLPAIDVLVNNAGLSLGVEATDDVILENFDSIIATNISGLFYVTRQAVRGMRAANRGHIVNLGSVGWMCPFPGGNAYAASKAAVHSLTQSFRSDVRGTTIRVSEVLPGMVRTNFTNVRFDNDPERFEQTYHGMTPLTAEDVADAVFYCVDVPVHVNIESIVMFPQSQILGPAVVTRQS